MRIARSTRQIRSTAPAEPQPGLIRRWRRRLARIPPEVFALAWPVAALLLGLPVLRWGPPSNRAGAALLVVAGVAGIVHFQRRMVGRFQAKQRRHEEAERRSVQHGIRRQREAREQEDRKRRAAAATIARTRATELENARRAAELAQAADVAEQRRSREEAIVRDAERLRSLNSAQLLDAAAEAFRGRGYIVSAADDEAHCDLILSGVNGAPSAVARLVPSERRADAADVRAFDQWRENAGAPSGFLIALSGFAPGAVRLAAGLPITLVEAHLLAQWRSG